MAGLRKDVELIFRGEDRASPTIKNVRKNVTDLTNSIQDQLSAAARGEGSIDDLAKAYRKLGEARGDISEITKLAVAFEQQGQKLAEQNTKVTEAIAKHKALADQMAATEKPAKRLQNAFAASERKLDSESSKLEQQKARFLELGAALDAAGGDSKNFAKTQDVIRQAAIETARAVRDAAAAMDEFRGKQASGKANVAAVDETAQFNKLAAGSGLPQAQIQFIAGLENRLEALGAAIKADQASMASLNAELRDRASTDAAARVRAMAQSLNEAEAAAERLKVTSGIRQMATEIAAGAREVSRFGPQLDSAATSASRLGAAIDGILNPTQKAATTLGGINAIIAQSEAIVDGAKRRLSEYNAEVNNLQAATAGLSGMARLIDNFRQQEAAVAVARKEFNAAQNDVLRLAAAIQQAQAPTQEMVTALQQADTALEKAGAAMQRETTKLVNLERSLKAAKIDVNNLAAAENNLVNSANRAAAAQQKLQAKTSGKGSFLGLNPNEMQNLGFQINDVVVSLISGQKPLTVLVQQGAQIGQIIPGAFAKIVRYAPQLIALAAIIATIAGAIKEADKEAAAARIGDELAASAGAADAAGSSYAILAKRLQDLGLSANDTRDALLQLSADGLDVLQMEQYIDAAQAAATATGVDLKDALETVRAAFQGGIDDIIALDDKTNIFTDSEIALIQQLYEQGRADEARAFALSIYAQKMQEVADKSQGPWSKAVDNLSGAWDNFLQKIANSPGPIRTVITQLDLLGRAAAYALGRLAGKSNEEALRDAGQGGAPRSNVVTVRLPQVRGKPQRTNAGNSLAAEDDRKLKAVQATTRAEKAALVVEEARREAANKGLNNLEIEEHKTKALAIFNASEDKKDAKRDAAAAKRGEAAAKRREAAAKRAAKAAEAEQNRLDNMEEGLQRQLEQLDSKTGKNAETLEGRVGAVDAAYKKLFRDIQEFSDKTGGRGKIGDLTIEQYKEQVRLRLEELKHTETLKFYEGQLSDLAEQRASKLEAVADQVERGLKSPEQGLKESRDIINDYATKMTTIATAALAFAESIRGAVPDPKLDAMIEKLKTVIQNNSAGQNTRAVNDVFKKGIEDQLGRLNTLTSQRNQLVDLENTKVQLGLQTQSDAQKRIMVLYQQSQPLILRHIAAIRAAAAAYGTALTPEMQGYFDALEANLNNVTLESEGVDASFNNLRGSINSLLTSNIVGFIDSVAQSFAKLITGKEDVLGFFASIGLALLQMIAQILQTVATLIIEALILDAVDKATGGILKPLLKIMAATVSFHHEGGIVGEGGHKGSVNPAIFAGAPRYHSGGIAGLQADEHAAILKRGEEVLTEADPRHRNNGGLQPAGGQGQIGIRQVLAIGDEEIANAMSGGSGENTVLTHIKRNATTIKQMLQNA